MQDVVPEIVGTVRAGYDHADTDDGDIAGRGVVVDRLFGRHRPPLENRLGAAADILMQVGEREHVAVQRRHLADHVHAVADLLLGLVVGQLALGIAHAAFRGHAQTAQIKGLQLVADIVGRRSLAEQLAPAIVEIARKRRVGAAGRVARAGFQADRTLAGQRLIAVAGHGGAGIHDFPGEQIGTAHQRAHFHAAFGQRRGQCGQHGAGHAIVHAAGEQHVDIAGFAGRNIGQQHVDHLLPQREAGQRADMAAAFAALEHEPFGALFQIHAQQRGRRRMDICRDAAILELGGLVGAATGDKRERWLVFPDFGDLFFAQLLRHEPEYAHAPGQRAHPVAGFGEQLAHLFAAHQRQRQEWQSTVFRHRVGEFGRIGNPGHRPLSQRILGAVRGGQRCIGGQMTALGGLGNGLCAERADGLHKTSGAPVTRYQRLREPDVLAQRAQLIGAAPAGHGLHLLAPAGGVDLAGFGGARDPVGFGQQRAGRAGMHPAGRVEQLTVEPRFGTVETAQFVLRGIVERRLGQQQQLIAEHHTGRAGDPTGSGRMHADAAVDVHRLVGLIDKFLQQDIAGIGTDPAATFMPARHQRLGRAGQAIDGVLAVDLGPQVP